MGSTVASAVQPDTNPTVDRGDPLRRRQYANPPVIEGIARFQWAEPLPWSFTTAGLLFEHLRGEYPGEPRAQAQVSAEVVTDSNSVLPSTGFELRKGPERIIYSSEDGDSPIYSQSYLFRTKHCFDGHLNSLRGNRSAHAHTGFRQGSASSKVWPRRSISCSAHATVSERAVSSSPSLYSRSVITFELVETPAVIHDDR